jgi:hypothetical protein
MKSMGIETPTVRDFLKWDQLLDWYQSAQAIRNPPNPGRLISPEQIEAAERGLMAAMMWNDQAKMHNTERERKKYAAPKSKTRRVG